MGLDMYLTGRRFVALYNAPVGTEAPMEKGYEVEEIHVKLGYWRKHADLHGYIVREFGPKDDKGHAEDNCQPIALDMTKLEKIIADITADVPSQTTTSGFFFGSSDKPGSDGFDQQKQEDLAVFGHAVQWLLLQTTANDGWYSVEYRASW